MSFSELKLAAKQSIKGNILILLLCTIIVSAISSAVGSISFFVGGIGSLLVLGPLEYGMIKNHKLISNGEKANVETLFTGFKECFANSFINLLLVGLYTLLWSMLFLIPGIIKSYSYSMSLYIQVDNPQLSPSECITRSRQIMNGNKMRYFLLQLSFFGWILLSILTLGILFIWVGPYIQQTTYNFYKSIAPSEREDEMAQYRQEAAQ